MQIKKWNFEDSEVRTIDMNGEPWFVARDVATILGFTNSRKALADHVDAEDKGVTKCDTLGGVQEMAIINESGVYALIFGSKLPTAHKFKHWVTADVLPTIRRHGVFAVDEVLTNPDILINALLELKKERQQNVNLQQTIAVQNQQIAEMKPKASYYDVVLNCKDLVAATVIAKDYGWSAKKLNRYLQDKGVQFKKCGIWLLYQKYAENGYTSTKTCPYDGSDGSVHTKPHTYWTQKGRLFIYDLLKADGILPLIESEEEM